MKNRKKYILLNVALAITIMAVFILVGIDKFLIVNKKISLIIFVVQYILLLYLGMRVGMKYRKKRWFDIFLNVVSPLGAYFFTWQWIVISKNI